MRASTEYVSDLKKMKKNVYVGGEKVDRDSSRVLPGVRVMSITYDLAHDPDWAELMTATSSLTGEKINRFTHLPQNPYDLMQKQKMIRLTAQRAGGCIQRCMGHDAINALAICTKEMDDRLGTEYHRRFLDYLREFQQKDWCAACAQTDMKGDRTKRPSQQPDPDAYVHVVEERDDGIVVRGAKISITMAAYADEIIVLPTRVMREEDQDYAVAFAVPADWDRVRLITRPVWLRESQLKTPFSQYGVFDSMIIFDDTFIPKERVFMCREWQFSRRLALLFADSHRQVEAVRSLLDAGATIPFIARYRKEKTGSLDEVVLGEIRDGLARLAAQWRAGIRVIDPWLALELMGGVFLTWGQRQRAEEAWREFRDMAERTGSPTLIMTSMALDGLLVTLDGRLEDAVEIANRIQARCDELGLQEFASNTVLMAAGRAWFYLGRADEFPVAASDDPFKFVYDAIRFAYFRQKAEAVEILEAPVVQRPGFGSADDETIETADVYLLEAAVLVEYHEAAELLLARLADSSMRACWTILTGIGRHLGAAAVMLGRPDDARKYYGDALKVATDMRFRPEIALTRLQLAELLLEHYPDEKPEALEHLDFAIAEFRDMKMQPSLERALRHKEILGA